MRKNKMSESAYKNGVDSSDLTSGSATLASMHDNSPSHGLKGILGRMRSEGMKSSGYSEGDTGGSAGHIMGHGFEGGARGGGVSAPETLPSQPMLPKQGFDEHKRKSGAASVHGIDGVEGIKTTSSGGAGTVQETQGSIHGLACPHGCGARMTSSHGLARHIHSKHGGFGGMGKALHGLMQKSHGSSYDEAPGRHHEEFKGETEYESDMQKIAREYNEALKKRPKPTSY